MKAIFLFLATLVTAGLVYGDIPIPGKDYKTYVYGGEQCKQKFISIKTPAIPGNVSGWSGEAQAYKVERSEDGLQQTVITVNYNVRNPAAVRTYSCVATKSINGQPVPGFVRPPLRQG